MQDAKDRVGSYRMSIAFCSSDQERETRTQRQVEALTAWLAARFESEQREVDHVARHSAG